jgi:formate hydrogenlyase subunit 3/multisubunit Na+/H+ antiporter MnhD subunit
MQALLIFFFFSCAALFYLHLPFTSLFLSKVLQNQTTIQSNQQISYQPDTDSLLNILQLI